MRLLSRDGALRVAALTTSAQVTNMFNRLKIAAKLLIGFGVLLLLLAGVSGFSVFGGLKSKDSIEELASLKNNEVLDQRVEKQVFEASMRLWMALATDDQGHWAKSDEAMKIAGESIDDLASNTMDPNRQEKISQWDLLIDKYKQASSKFRSLHGQNAALNTPEGKAAVASAMEIGSDLTSIGETLAKEYGRAADATEAEAKRTASLMVAVAVGVGLASLLIGLLLSVLISRSIKLPIVKLTDVMTALAKGDLQVQVPSTTEPNEIGEMAKAVVVFKENAIAKIRRDAELEEQRRVNQEAQRRAEEEAIRREREMVSASIGEGLAKLAAQDLTFRMTDELPEAYGQLQKDFNSALSQLEAALGGISEGARAINSTTQEIAAAADDLSKRTEQQAATLEQTSAALQEITITVRKAAEGASHAAEVVETTKGDAERNGVVVGQAVEAMSRIEKSSQEITQIVGVIDEIAFQTNLLALNAGVEAARAGDAGRGFAVVASEVRGLAQRSAEAAKEIKSLISASSTQVDQGVRLVGQTGKALEKIVVQFGEINRVVAEIAAGAKAQASSLGEVNSAIGQMDQGTQKNAAMVEETTAATHSLRRECVELEQKVSQFQVANDRGGQSASLAPIKRPAPGARPALKTVAGGAGSAVRKPAPQAHQDSWAEF